MNMTPEEAEAMAAHLRIPVTPMTTAALAQQILLWIRRTQAHIRENPGTIVSAHLHALVGDIVLLCKEQLAGKDLSMPEEQPASLPGLIEGRVIHYVAYNGRHLAGMVIGHNASEGYSQADLVIFTNMSNVNGVKNFGMQFHSDVEYSASKLQGTWHWPEKA